MIKVTENAVKKIEEMAEKEGSWSKQVRLYLEGIG